MNSVAACSLFTVYCSLSIDHRKRDTGDYGAPPKSGVPADGLSAEQNAEQHRDQRGVTSGIINTPLTAVCRMSQ